MTRGNESDADDLHPWRRGRLDDRDGPAALLFGRMFEDAEIELAVIPAGSRVFCIASAGCVALALSARGDDVTCADVNLAQVEYVVARAAGAPPREGLFDRMMALGRRRLRFAGLDEDPLRAFLTLDDPPSQAAMLSARPAWLAALSSLLRPLTDRDTYDRTFARALPPDFERVFAARILRTVSRHPNRDNPFLRRLLLDDPPPVTSAPTPLRVLHADAATLLESGPAASFDAFCLSNIEDGATDEESHRLEQALRHAAAPGAIVVTRSLGEPTTDEEAEWAARDRAALWGRIRLRRFP